MNITKASIAIVVTAHNEGILLHNTLQNIALCRDYAIAKQSVTIDVLIILDRCSPITRSVAQTFLSEKSWGSLSECDFGDPGLARNHGISLVAAEIVVIWDGDDLMSPSWLEKAYLEYSRRGPRAVIVPEYIATFGNEHILRRQVAIDDGACDFRGLLWSKFWGPWHLTNTENHRNIVYQAVSTVQQTGFEDWHWNCQALFMGLKFFLAKETAVYYRQRSGSRLAFDKQYGVKIRSSEFFRKEFFVDFVNA